MLLVLCPGVQFDLTTYFCTHPIVIVADIHELFLVLYSVGLVAVLRAPPLSISTPPQLPGGPFRKNRGLPSDLLINVDLMAFTWSTIPSFWANCSKEQWECLHKVGIVSDEWYEGFVHVSNNLHFPEVVHVGIGIVVPQLPLQPWPHHLGHFHHLYSGLPAA